MLKYLRIVWPSTSTFSGIFLGRRMREGAEAKLLLGYFGEGRTSIPRTSLGYTSKGSRSCCPSTIMESCWRWWGLSKRNRTRRSSWSRGWLIDFIYRYHIQMYKEVPKMAGRSDIASWIAGRLEVSYSAHRWRWTGCRSWAQDTSIVCSSIAIIPKP